MDTKLHKCRMAAVAILLALVFSTASCSRRGIAKVETDNPEITPTLLFELDGVKVYRFSDAGEWIYFADARGRVEWSELRHRGDKSNTTTRKHRAVETVD